MFAGLHRRLCLGSWALLRPLCDCSWALRRLLLRLLGRPFAPCGPFFGGFVASRSAARGAPFLLMPGLMGAPPPIVTPLPVTPLLRALSLLVAVLPLVPPLVGLRCGFSPGPWAPLRPSCDCSCYCSCGSSWTLRRCLLWHSRSLPCSVRYLVRLLCCLLLLRSWGSVVAYARARGRSSALCVTARGRFAALCSTVFDRSLAPLLCTLCFKVAFPPSAPLLVGLRCGPCLGPWALLRLLCDCACVPCRLCPSALGRCSALCVVIRCYCAASDSTALEACCRLCLGSRVLRGP